MITFNTLNKYKKVMIKHYLPIIKNNTQHWKEHPVLFKWIKTLILYGHVIFIQIIIMTGRKKVMIYLVHINQYMII
jgi:hypothetical protein